MSNSPSIDIKDYLVSQGLGTFGSPSSWEIRIGEEPDHPDQIITIYDTGGPPPNPKWLLDEPHWQIRYRSFDYVVGWNKAEEIKSHLLGLMSQSLGGTWYVGIWVVIDTRFLLKDSRGRSVFTNSWRCIREPDAGQHRRPL